MDTVDAVDAVEAVEAVEAELPLCAICHEDLDPNCSENPLYKLPECGHTFHAACSVHWFRQYHDTCPLCKNVGTAVTSQSLFDVKLRYANASILARKANASNEMKKQYKRIRLLNEKIADCIKLNREIQSSVGVFKDLKRKFRSNRTKRWRFNRQLWREKRILVSMCPAVKQVIIPVRVNIS